MTDRDQWVQELYRYRPAVRSFFRRLGFSPAESDDLTHDVYLRIFTQVDEHGYHGKTVSYVEMVARRVAHNAKRDRKATDPDSRALFVDARTASPEAVRAREDDVARLRAAIETLDVVSRKAIMLRMDGLSYRAIAEVLHLSVSAVRSRFNAARVELRQQLAVGESLHDAQPTSDNSDGPHSPIPPPEDLEDMRFLESELAVVLDTLKLIGRRESDLLGEVEAYKYELHAAGAWARRFHRDAERRSEPTE